MEGSQNSTFLSTSDVGLVVKRSNPIRIWGAELKAALVGLILVEPSVDESPFVPGVGHGTPSPLGAWHLLTASDRDWMIRQAMRMDLLQEVTVIVEHYIRVKSAQIFISNRPCSAWSWRRFHRKCRDDEISLCCMLRLVRQ